MHVENFHKTLSSGLFCRYRRSDLIAFEAGNLVVFYGATQADSGIEFKQKIVSGFFTYCR